MKHLAISLAAIVGAFIIVCYAAFRTSWSSIADSLRWFANDKLIELLGYGIFVPIILFWLGFLVLVLVSEMCLFALAERLTRRNRLAIFTFRSGRKGEQTAAGLFGNLPNDFHVFKNVILRPKVGNIDDVIVGPNGVFAIEVKNHKGDIEVDGHSLTARGKSFPRVDPLRQTMRGALQVHDKLFAETGLDVFVKPILVFTNTWANVKCPPSIGNVFVTSAPLVNHVITSTRGSLAPEALAKIVEALRKVVEEQ